MESAKEAKQIILEDNKSARVDIMKLDLCSVKSVRSFVENFLALDLPLNILMYVENYFRVLLCQILTTELIRHRHKYIIEVN